MKNKYLNNNILLRYILSIFLLATQMAIAQYGPLDDFDADEINNLTDLDDDNDGILDDQECPPTIHAASAGGSSNTITVGGFPDTYEEVVDPTLTLTHKDVNNSPSELSVLSTTTTNANEIYALNTPLTFMRPTTSNINHIITLSTTANVVFMISDIDEEFDFVTVTVHDEFGAKVTNLISYMTSTYAGSFGTYPGSTWSTTFSDFGSDNSNFDIIDNNTSVDIDRVGSGTGSNNFARANMFVFDLSSVLVSEIEFHYTNSGASDHPFLFFDKIILSPPASCDTDGDGADNNFDLDSDGDGCNDANEAYDDLNADNGDGGQYGVENQTLSGGGVSGDGKLVAATYTSPAIAPSGDKAHTKPDTIIITEHPADTTFYWGGFVTFTASASLGVGTSATYQWQKSTDGGTTFADISFASGSYTSGEQLIYTELTESSDSINQYRVVFIGGNVCSGISNAAVLTSGSRPEICDNNTDDDKDGLTDCDDPDCYFDENSLLDFDNDSMPDFCDHDDDNDGIDDVYETGCPGYFLDLSSVSDGAPDVSNANIDGTVTFDGAETGNSTVNYKPGGRLSGDLSFGVNSINETMIYTITFSEPVDLKLQQAVNFGWFDDKEQWHITTPDDTRFFITDPINELGQILGNGTNIISFTPNMSGGHIDPSASSWSITANNITSFTMAYQSNDLATYPQLSVINLSVPCIIIDTDGDGQPNNNDLDADNDGIYDVVEAGGADSNTDGFADGAIDVNGIPSSAGGGLTPPDTDNDGDYDFLDTDSDDDNCSDANEAYADTTADGGDGEQYGTGEPAPENPDGTVIAASYTTGAVPAVTDNDSSICPVYNLCADLSIQDSDNDGINDACDLDDDNDGILDSDEECIGYGGWSNSSTSNQNFDLSLGEMSNIITSSTDYVVGSGLIKSTITVPPVVVLSGVDQPSANLAIANGDIITMSFTISSSLPYNNDKVYWETIFSSAIGTPSDYDLQYQISNDGITYVSYGTFTKTSSFPYPETFMDHFELLPGNTYYTRLVFYNAQGGTTIHWDDHSMLFTCSSTGGDHPNHTDLDTDNDGIYDVVEAGGTDINNDGFADGVIDTNGVPSSASGGLTPPDTDSDGYPDFLDTDSDNDGCSDANEAYADTTADGGDGEQYGTGEPPAENSDGTVLAAAYTTGAVPAVIDNTSSICPVYDPCSDVTLTDTDNDGIPNTCDLDIDNDGILNSVETAGCTSPIPVGYSAYWPYEQSTSDVSGNNHNLQNSPSVSYSTNSVGGNYSVSFDGTYLLQYNDGSFLNKSINAFTYSLWFNTNTISGGIKTLIDEGGTANGFLVLQQNADIVVVTQKNGAWVNHTSQNAGVTLNINQWYHVAVTYNNGTLKLYLDGALLHTVSTAGPANIPAHSDPSGFGGTNQDDAWGWTTGNYFQGLIDEIVYYEIALTDAQINDLYTAPTPTFCDEDGDGIENHLDLDSDNDGIYDVVEASGTDADSNGIADGVVDANGVPGSASGGLAAVDTDNDGNPDFLDIDSDGDGCSDPNEAYDSTNGDGGDGEQFGIGEPAPVDTNGLVVSAPYNTGVTQVSAVIDSVSNICLGNLPVAINDTTTTAEETPTVINVLANDSSVDRLLDSTSVDTLSSPINGNALINAISGAITYTPNINFNGLDSFTYSVCDTGLPVVCASATVFITVTPTNDLPLAVDDDVSTPLEIAVSIDVQANDSDPDGDILTTSTIGSSTEGVAPVVLNDDSINYTPPASFSGTDTFNYQICDPGAACDTASVVITVVSGPCYDLLKPDADNDGLIDSCDLDNDNDGILDTDEGFYCSDVPGFGAYSPNEGSDTPRLEAYWPYEGSTDDSSGNNHHLQTPQSSVMYSDNAIAGDSSLYFDETYVLHYSTDNDFLEKEISNFSWSFWFNTSDAFDSQGLIDEGGAGDGVYIYKFNYKVYAVIGESGSLIWSSSSSFSNVVNDTWHHVAFTYDNGNASLYFDGVQEDITTPFGSLILHSNNSGFGGINGSSANWGMPAGAYLGGYMDEIYYYESTLTPQQVAILYGAPTCIANPDLDSDGDGIANRFDLDSDNDGVFDVVEAGGTDADSSGKADGAIDMNGIPSSASGGLTVLDTDNDGNFDFLDTDSDNDGCSDANEAYADSTADGGDGEQYGIGEPAPENPDGTVIAASYNTGITQVPAVIDANSNVCIIPNGPPIAVNDYDTTSEDTPLVINIISNDSDIEGPLDSTSVDTISSPANGSISINPTSGEITYTPDLNFNGIDSFEYEVCDTGAPVLCDTAMIYITVTPVNDPPIVINDTSSTNEDYPLAMDVVGNDSDDQGPLDSTSVDTISSPANGSISINPISGVITYSPNSDFNGIDSFQYAVCDTGSPVLCDSAIAYVTVNPVNDPPVAVDDNTSTLKETTVIIDVQTNDNDPDGDTLTTSIIGTSTEGVTPTILNGDSISYSPPIAFSGIDTFSYQVCDQSALCDTASVVIIVFSGPCYDPSKTDTDNDGLIDSCDLDDDNDGILDSIELSMCSYPIEGYSAYWTYEQSTDDVSGNNHNIQNSPSVVYSSNSAVGDYSVSFDGTYKLQYSSGTFLRRSINTFTYSLWFNTNNVNRFGPLIDEGGYGDAFLIAHNTDIIVRTEKDNNGTQLTAGASINPNQWYHVAVTYDNGIVKLYLDGALRTTVTTAGSANIPWHSDPSGFGGTNQSYAMSPSLFPNYFIGLMDEIVYYEIALSEAQITQLYSIYIPVFCDSDGDGVGNQQDLDSDNDGIYDVVEVGGTDINQDGFADGTIDTNGVPISSSGGLTTIDTDNDGNADFTDTDSDNDRCSDANEAYADTTADGGDGEQYGTGEPAPENPDGTVIAASYNTGITQVPAVLDANSRICIIPNSPPIAVNDNDTTSKGTPLVINIINNDSDIDGPLDSNSVDTISSPANGLISINSANGEITYTPNPNFFGIDSFEYEVCDTGAPVLCDTAMVYVTVLPAPPIAINDTTTTNEDSPLAINVIGNDSAVDAPLDPTSVDTVSSPANGLISINPISGEIIYTPNLNFNGIDSFIYSVCDSGLLVACDSATVFVDVTPINDPPVVVDDDVFTIFETAVIIDVQANDSDTDSDTLTTSIIGTSTEGVTPTVLNGNNISYSPPIAFSEIDTFNYQVCDQGALCDTALVVITILSGPCYDTSKIDTDNDGLIDSCDLDDDNDGILDSIEFSACPYPPEGYSAHWPYEQSTDDVSGNNHNLQNSPSVVYSSNSAVGDYSVSFDGSYMLQYNDVQFLGKEIRQFTYSLWFNTNSINRYGVLIDEGSNGSGIVIAHDNDDISVVIQKYSYGLNETSLTAGVAINANQWYHVAVTFDYGVIKLYVDGVLRSTSSSPGPPSIPWHMWDASGFGGTNQGYASSAFGFFIPFLGLMDEIVYYESVLSNAQITHLYSAFCDTDGDGVENHLDLDSDNDGIYDVVEAEGKDINQDGFADGVIDIDGVPSSSNGGIDPIDTYNDGTPDYVNTDSDADDCSDADEAYESPIADGDDGGQYGTGEPAAVDTNGLVLSAPYNTGITQVSFVTDSSFKACLLTNLSLTITVDNISPFVEDTLTFTITVSNAGPDPTNGVSIQDYLPSGLSNAFNISSSGTLFNDTISWSGISLDSGDLVILTYQAIVEPPVGVVDEYKTIAQITASNVFDFDSSPNNDDGDQSEDDESSVLIIPKVANLSLIKSVDNNTPSVGDTLTFTLNIDNIGPDTATSVEIEDILPIGFSSIHNISNSGILFNDTIKWTGLTITTSGLILTYQAIVNTPTFTANEYKNIAQISASRYFDPNSTPNNDDGDQSEDDEDSSSINVLLSNLSLTKSVDTLTPFIGDTVSFTINVSNLGPETATGVSIEDYIPSGFNSIFNISNGGSISNDTIRWSGLTVSVSGINLTYQSIVGVSMGLADEYKNIAQVTASDNYDFNSTPNNDDGDQSEDDEANLIIDARTVNVSLNKIVSTDTPSVGDTITFTIDVANSGPDTATGINIEDYLPIGYSGVHSISTSGVLSNDTILWMGLTIDTATNLSLTFKAIVNVATGTVGEFKNTAQVTSSDYYDSNSIPNNDDGDQSEDDEDSITIVPPNADLSLVKSVVPVLPNIGDTVNYTLAISNSGPKIVTGVDVDDILPVGISNISNISNGGILTNDTIKWTNLTITLTGLNLTFQGVVEFPTGVPNEYKNIAQITNSDLFDPDSSPNNDDGDQSEDDESFVIAKPPNQKPIALNDTSTTLEDTPIAISVLNNDDDIEGPLDSTSVDTISSPTNGSIYINPISGEITYTSDLNFNGGDSFNYMVCDTGLPILCDTAMIYITVSPVNDPPVAIIDARTTPEETLITIEVQSNDSDPENDPFVGLEIVSTLVESKGPSISSSLFSTEIAIGVSSRVVEVSFKAMGF